MKQGSRQTVIATIYLTENTFLKLNLCYTQVGRIMHVLNEPLHSLMSSGRLKTHLAIRSVTLEPSLLSQYINVCGE